MRITLVVALLFVTVLHAASQEQAPKSNVEQQLKGQYRITRVGANGVVLQAGSVLIVQKDNIKANPASNQIYWSNLYKKDARVKQPAIMVKSGVAGVDKSTIRFFQTGEKVYVANIEIKPADVVFSLQSCGSCNASAPDPNDVPYRAELSFQFQKGFVDTVNLKEIQDTIGQVFAVAPANQSPAATGTPAPTEPSASPGDVPLKPIQAPPPPEDQPSPPKAISRGDTKEQVVAAFGQPEKMVKLDAKEIYYYKDLKVTFVNGKVADVQ